MRELEVSSFGPIRKAKLRFGDLTLLVGPQASGKSLLVQLFKVIQDASSVRQTLKQYGYHWLDGKNPRRDFLSLYFGGGMGAVWRKDTKVFVNGDEIDLMRQLVNPPGATSPKESVFLIPAQRVLILEDGWPKSFMPHATGAPYCLRSFSDTIRKLMEQGLGSGEAIFPQPRRLKTELRRLIDDGIYVGGTVRVKSYGMRKQIVLDYGAGGRPLPYSAWSAGQREFTPLLLGLYWLIPSTKISKQRGVDTVVIEEPEMGLHPQAIMSFCLLVLELLHRGYKVIISTHSPAVLDVVWAMQELGRLKDKEKSIKALTTIFKIQHAGPPIRELLASALKKSYKTYYFERPNHDVTVRDISSLDPGDPDSRVSGWGGLSGFSGHIADTVGRAISDEGDSR